MEAKIDRHTENNGHMDEHMEKIMLLLHTLTMRGSDAASLVEFHPVVYEEIAWLTDRQTDGGVNNISIAF